MADFIPVAFVARIALNYVWRGHVGAMIFHVLFPGAPEEADLGAMGELIRDWVYTYYRAEASHEITFTGLGMRVLTTATSLTLDYFTGFPITGSLGAESVTNSVALVVTWRTGRAGRSYRGRTYIAGVPLTQLNTPNIFGDAYVEEWIVAANALLAAVASFGGARLVVVSLQADKAPRIEGVSTPITGVTINNGVDNQRRRLKGAN